MTGSLAGVSVMTTMMNFSARLAVAIVNRPLLFVLLLAVGIGASGLMLAHGMSDQPDARTQAPRDRQQCFNPDFVRDFITVDDHKVIITTGRNQAYELTLGGVCSGLDTSLTIGIRTRFSGGDVCGPFDADVVFGGFGGDRLQSCPITKVRHLQGDEAEPYVATRRNKNTSQP